MPATQSDDELLAALKGRDLAGWQTLADALPTRFAQALAAAIKESEPKARRVSLPGATIHDQAELDTWLGQARAGIEAALATDRSFSRAKESQRHAHIPDQGPTQAPRPTSPWRPARSPRPPPGPPWRTSPSTRASTAAT